MPQIMMTFFGLSLLLMVIQLVRKFQLREEYALLWLTAGMTFSLAGIFVYRFDPLLTLFITLFFVLLISLSQSVKLSQHANSVRDLAQQVALLEWRLQQSEERERPFPSPNGIPQSLPSNNGHQPIIANGGQEL